MQVKQIHSMALVDGIPGIALPVMLTFYAS